MNFEPISLEDAIACMNGASYSTPSVVFVKSYEFKLYLDGTLIGRLWYRRKLNIALSIYHGTEAALDCLTRQISVLRIRVLSYSTFALVGFNRIPSFTSVTTLKCRDHLFRKTLHIDGANMAQLLSLSFENTGLGSLPTGVEHLTNLHTLNLDGCEFKEVPQQVASLPRLRSLSMQDNPLKVAPLFLCETKLRYFRADYNAAFYLKNIEQPNGKLKFDMRALRRIYQEFYWRKEVFQLIWENTAQPIAEELQDSLVFCCGFLRCVEECDTSNKRRARNDRHAKRQKK